MALRRYSELKPSAGTRIPPELRIAVLERDRGCVGFGRFPGECQGALELDHVRASRGMGMKSRTEADNLVSLCSTHHRWKTSFGREARPALLAYLATVEDPHAAHVDPCPTCPARGGAR